MRQLHPAHKVIGAMLSALLFCLLLSSSIYGWRVHFSEETLPPSLFVIILPALLSVAIGYPVFSRLVGKSTFHPRLHVLSGAPQRTTWLLTFLLTGSVLLLFQPASKSIRYNVGNVLHLDRIDSLPPYVQPTFLSLGEWHVDRLRVIPVHTYKQGKLWNSGNYYIKSYFLLPIFSKSTAYEAAAKAWLVFTYEHTIPAAEFARDRGQSSIIRSQNHFKKINVGAFLYFEKYPFGQEREALTQLSRRHSYFQRSYSGVYFGQDVDRDWVSFRYFFYFLLTFLLVILPIYVAVVYLLLRPVYLSSIPQQGDHADPHSE